MGEPRLAHLAVPRPLPVERRLRHSDRQRQARRRLRPPRRRPLPPPVQVDARLRPRIPPLGGAPQLRRRQRPSRCQARAQELRQVRQGARLRGLRVLVRLRIRHRRRPALDGIILPFAHSLLFYFLEVS